MLPTYVRPEQDKLVMEGMRTRRSAISPVSTLLA